MAKPQLVDHVLVEKQVESTDSTKLPGMNQKVKVSWSCEVCGITWNGEKPTDKCPGAKIYRWDRWPEGMLTKKQLSMKGLRPGPLAGVIPYEKSADGDGYLRIYRESEATPRPPRSVKQKAALERMHAAAEAARHCSECGGYLERYGTCERCDSRAQREQDRRDAAQEAYELICDGNFVVWDSETTDLNGRFIEIAAVDSYGKTLFNSRIRPDRLITPGAYEVHGIKDEELVSAPTFFEVYRDLRAALHRRHWVIYNASFDESILNRETWDSEYRTYFQHYPIAAARTTCAMYMYAAWYGERHSYYGSYQWQKLDFAARHVDIDLPAHSALGDALRTLEVLYEMADWYRSEYL
jgi:DNA polymerase III epsilon subunit-like protein